MILGIDTSPTGSCGKFYNIFQGVACRWHVSVVEVRRGPFVDPHLSIYLGESLSGCVVTLYVYLLVRVRFDKFS